MRTISKTEKGTWIVELEKEDLKFCSIYRNAYNDSINVSFDSYEYDKCRKSLEEAREKLKSLLDEYSETLKILSKAGTLLGILTTENKVKK